METSPKEETAMNEGISPHSAENNNRIGVEC